MDSVCDGSTGCRDDILHLCASAAGNTVCTEPPGGIAYGDGTLHGSGSEDHRCTLGGKICKCTAVVLSVASTGIPDLQEYRSRIFSGWRSQIRIHDKRTGKGGKVYFHGVLHRRRRYYVEYDP